MLVVSKSTPNNNSQLKLYIVWTKWNDVILNLFPFSDLTIEKLTKSELNLSFAIAR